MSIKALVLSLLALAVSACALYLFLYPSEPDSPLIGVSPNGQLGFMETNTLADVLAINLVDRKSGDSLLLTELDHGSQWQVLWSPDSARVALMFGPDRLTQDLSVFVRAGQNFHVVRLPELIVEIPESFVGNGRYPHVAVLDAVSAIEWNADGSLLVSIQTILDGAGESLDATRMVLLGIEPDHTSRILSSSVTIDTTSSD